MPIWKISLVNGTFQVADADGALYPLTMGGAPITYFNDGWSPRGLQTGLPPLHVMELEHVGGDSTIWLHDETLDYRANAVLGLSPDDQNRFFAVLDPIVHTLYQECVLAPHASIPAAAHQFDGMLPRTIHLLLQDAVQRTMPPSDLVVLDRLDELGAGYGSGATALSADWIARAIAAPAEAAQERFTASGRQYQRHLDAATGTVFYVAPAEDAAETQLYVPSARVVFARTRHTHDPLLLLLQYYAGNTERVVSLPEALELPPELAMAAPQHGLDEPPQQEELPAAAVAAPVAAPVAVPVPAHADAPVAEEAPSGPAMRSADHAAPENDASQPASEPAHETARTVFEAPLMEMPHAHEALEPATTPIETGRGPTAHVPDAAPPPARPMAQPVAPTASPDQRYAARPAAPPPKQNWWQRLLGLGNP